MRMPPNRFKAALKAGRRQIGFWNTIGGHSVPEALATCGYDWLLIDTEHSAVDTLQVLPALQAMAAWPEVSPVVRPAANDAVLIKRLLDFGAQTLLIPYVNTAAEAEAAVTATTYGPRGVRGMAGLTRATRYGTVENYFATASDDVCLIVQVETREALENLEAIAGTDGVDAVFIGPADLSASLGYPGQLSHPQVVAAIEDTLLRLKSMDVPSGILTLDEAFARRCMDWGTTVTAIGVDMASLLREAKALRARF